MMPHPKGYFLARIKIGRLVAPTDDSRVAEVMAAPNRVRAWASRGSSG